MDEVGSAPAATNERTKVSEEEREQQEIKGRVTNSNWPVDG